MKDPDEEWEADLRRRRAKLHADQARAALAEARRNRKPDPNGPDNTLEDADQHTSRRTA